MPLVTRESGFVMRAMGRTPIYFAGSFAAQLRERNDHQDLTRAVYGEGPAEIAIAFVEHVCSIAVVLGSKLRRTGALSRASRARRLIATSGESGDLQIRLLSQPTAALTSACATF